MRERDAVLSAVAMAAAAVLGLVLGMLLAPDAVGILLGALGVQAALAGLALLSGRYPVSWVLAVCVGVVLVVNVNPLMADLLRQGAVPWVTVALATASYRLVRSPRTPSGVVVGFVGLAAAWGSVVVFAIDNSAGIAQAALAAMAPVLAGALLSLATRLREAQQDRLDRGTAERAMADEPQHAAYRALTLVALRADALAESTSERRTRDAARDLRATAVQGLAGPGFAGPDTAGNTGGTGDVGDAEDPRPSKASGDAEGTERSKGSEGSAEPRQPAGDLVRLSVAVSVERSAQPDPTRTAEPPPELGEREREILRLLATGASNAAIARDLYLSEATIKGYVSRLMKRLDRGNRTQLALLASRWFD